MRATRRRHWNGWWTAQLALGLWLFAAPVVYPPGVPALLTAKDVLAGVLLVGVTFAASVGRATVLAERLTCLGIGAVLLVLTAVLDDGVGAGSIFARWNEVVTAVVLILLAAARTGEP